MWFKSVYTHIKRKQCVFQTSHFNTDIIANLLPENRLAEREKRSMRWSNRNNALAFMNYISAFILKRFEDFRSLCIYPRREWINHHAGVIPFYMHWEPYLDDNNVHIKHLLWIIWNASDAQIRPDSHMSMEMSWGELLYQDIYLLQKIAKGEYGETKLFLMTLEFWVSDSDFGKIWKDCMDDFWGATKWNFFRVYFITTGLFQSNKNMFFNLLDKDGRTP